LEFNVSKIDLSSFHDHLTLVASDRALLNSFKASHPRLVQLFGQIADDAVEDERIQLSACPPLENITALQLSIFDNWKFKERGVRWGANIKVWLPERVNFLKRADWSANIALWPASEAVKRAKMLQSPKLRRPISDSTVERIGEAVPHFAQGYVGIMKHMNPKDGTYYYDDHILCAEIEKDVVMSAFVFSPAFNIAMPEFKNTDANGKRLKDRAVAQARHSFSESMQGWATGEARRL
jgi:hypothetical protein